MINEEITSNEISTVSNPVNELTEAVIQTSDVGNDGTVWLQEKCTDGDWVSITNQTGAFVIVTPDTTIEYRFKAINCTKTVRVYFN